MDWALASQNRERVAIGLSLAIHACALAALAALLAGRLISDTGPVEKDVVLPVTTLVHRDPAPAKVARVNVRPAAPAGTHAHVEIRRYVRIATHATSSPPVQRRPVPVVAAAPVRRSDPVEPAQAAPEPAPDVAVVRRVAVAAVATAVPAASSEPAPADSATPVAAVGADYSGLFSQNYPPAFASPDELASIRAEVSGPVRVRVEIDESGHATDVEFLGTIADASLAAHVRSELLDLHYVPADCNGLHCEGSLVVTI